MSDEIEEIIRKLERVQDLLHRGDTDDAATATYEAQCMLIFLRDNKAN